MSESEHTPSAENNRNYKVGRVLDDYDLPHLDAKLGKMWLGTGSEDPHSLRELSDIINKHLLRRSMECAGIDPLDGETEGIYRILTDDNIDNSAYQNTVQRLHRENVEIQELQRDFVTHQSVYNYLKKFKNIEHGLNDRDDTSTAQELRKNLFSDVEKSIESIQQTENIYLENFRFDVDVRAHCTDCDQSFILENLLNNGGCDCV